MGFNSPETLHAMIEAKKIAWADRAKFYADPAFREDSARRIDLEALRGRAPQADRSESRRAKQSRPAIRRSNDGDTIYMCTADDEGNMVCLIQSNYRGMGSGIVVPGLGFMFQDRGELFSMEPGHANVYAPGKRPFHTIIPGLRHEGRQAVASVRRDGRRDAAAGPRPGPDEPDRFRHGRAGSRRRVALAARRRQRTDRRKNDGDGGYVNVESGVPYETVRELKKKGHDVRFDVGGYGGYQAIKVEMHDGQRVYVGASESRKDGQAAGY